MKKCIKCNKIKDFSDFPRRKDSKDGYKNICKACRLDYQRLWHKGEIKKPILDAPKGMKVCRKCDQILKIENFGRSKQNKDGLKSYCKSCKRAESKKWRDKNKKKCKKYRESIKDKQVEYNKKYRVENKNKIAKKKEKYVAKNKEAIAVQKKIWYEKNKQRILEEKKTYYEENKEKIIAREQMYLKNSITAQIRKKLRSRFYQAVKKGYKAGSAVRDLGCSVEELKIYLENKFQPGMTWNNYGEWHIDHIIPLSSFNLTDREQVKMACHYTNLQPLWAEDNLKKWAKKPQN